jgi:hypothetical protein
VETTFGGACALLETALDGLFRRRIVAAAGDAVDARTALARLRDSMQSNAWKAGAVEVGLGKIVRTFDARTRAEGFHVLHDWDGKADHVSEDTIPVDVLDYLARLRGSEPPNAAALAILVDYYFAHVLALVAMRIWDEGDADENLDRVSRLLSLLQGADGSGQRFAADAETLLLIGTSHFEVVEIGYEKLLARVKTLDRVHRRNIAMGHAASMGSHLRFGFEATYNRDTVIMRRDNVADYPWLCFAMATLAREYARMSDEGAPEEARSAVAEAMLNGLSADARALVGEPPSFLSDRDADRAEFASLYRRYEREWLERFAAFRPSADAYSPLSFFFNFSHNVVKGTVVDALLRGQPWRLTLNDLLTARPIEASDPDSKEALAKTLMGYARASPDTIGGRLAPVIVYDPQAGRQAFAVTMRKLRE